MKLSLRFFLKEPMAASQEKHFRFIPGMVLNQSRQEACSEELQWGLRHSGQVDSCDPETYIREGYVMDDNMKWDYHGLLCDLLKLYESHFPHLLPLGLGRASWGSRPVGVHVLGYGVQLAGHSLPSSNKRAVGKINSKGS